MKKVILLVLALCLCFPAFGTAFAEEAAESGPVLNDGTPWVDYSLRENIAQVSGSRIPRRMISISGPITTG
jgi:hypothetical protein